MFHWKRKEDSTTDLSCSRFQSKMTPRLMKYFNPIGISVSMHHDHQVTVHGISKWKELTTLYCQICQFDFKPNNSALFYHLRSNVALRLLRQNTLWSVGWNYKMLHTLTYWVFMDLSIEMTGTKWKRRQTLRSVSEFQHKNTGTVFQAL